MKDSLKIKVRSPNIREVSDNLMQQIQIIKGETRNLEVGKEKQKHE